MSSLFESYNGGMMLLDNRYPTYRGGKLTCSKMGDCLQYSAPQVLTIAPGQTWSNLKVSPCYFNTGIFMGKVDSNVVFYNNGHAVQNSDVITTLKVFAIVSRSSSSEYLS